MSRAPSDGTLSAFARPERVLATLGSAGRGPTLIVVGGLHGNEPAGWEASRRVAADLVDREADLEGRVVFLTGNRTALARGCRFVDRDLNRAWTDHTIARLRRTGPGNAVEDDEQAELLDTIEAILADAGGRAWLLDLHTTSGTGGAFSVVSDTLPARELALRLPVPLVLGLEEMVDGTLHDWMQGSGVVTVVFEAGQHAEAEAVDRAEAAIWLLIEAVGLLHPTRLSEAADARKRLARHSRGLPTALEMRYRHPVRPGDEFVMAEGWVNFGRVRKDTILAEDARGVVRAPESGRILMPLYQAQGSDGFFVVREFSPFWLWLSEVMRRVGLASVAHLLPGIRRHPARPGVYVVNRRVARWYALQVMHLLGFRRVREEGDVLVVERREA
ncbi:MAG: succinylglutamate desuccinylase/aspartoacylase family protein [Longimicrobiales bacterium]|nr:succinylglutamate desuccinylase/aspartoacylase family protein [Longimicrobiales bacterium]